MIDEERLKHIQRKLNFIHSNHRTLLNNGLLTLLKKFEILEKTIKSLFEQGKRITYIKLRELILYEHKM